MRIMEKSTPHYKLPTIKVLIVAGKVRSTMSALAGGAAMGIDYVGIIAVIMALHQKDFYKSITTLSDHKVCQDVYRPTTQAGEVYLKLTVVDDVLIVSFKEL